MPSPVPTSSSTVSLLSHPPQHGYAVAFGNLFSEYGTTGAPRVPIVDAPTSKIPSVSTQPKSRRWYALFSRRKPSAGGAFHKLDPNPDPDLTTGSVLWEAN